MIIIYSIVNVIIIGKLMEDVNGMKAQLDATSQLLLTHTEVHKLNNKLELEKHFNLRYPIVPMVHHD